jgi:hypothetical protein
MQKCQLLSAFFTNMTGEEKGEVDGLKETATGNPPRCRCGVVPLVHRGDWNGWAAQSGD